MSNYLTTLPGPIWTPPFGTPALLAAVYNASSPAVADGQMVALQTDNKGNLLVSATFSGTISGNAAAGPTGSAVPSSADYVGFNSGGTLVGVSSVNPLPITGSISATNPSVGTNAATAPTSSTQIGILVAGNLQPVSASNPVPISGSITASNPSVGSTGSTTPTSATLLGASDGTNLNALLVESSSHANLRVALYQGGSEVTVTGSNALKVDASGTTVPVSGTFWQATQPVSGTVTANAGTNLNTSLLALESGGNLATLAGAVTSSKVQVNVTNSTLAVTESGTWTTRMVGNGGATLDAAPGSAIPTNAVMVGGSDGVDIRAILTDANGQVKVLVENTTLAPLNGNIAQIAASTVATAATGVQKVGVVGNAGGAFDGATAASAPANAVQHGLVAATSYPTAVTNGQLVGGMADKAGRAAVVLSGPRDLIGSAAVQSTSGTPGTLIAAGATGVFNDITELVLTNENATTATIVSITDGTITYKFAIAAGGGLTKTFATPLPATSTATAWQVSNSAAVNVDVVVVYVKNK